MSRSASESSCCVVPVCGMHVPPPHASEKAAVARVVGRSGGVGRCRPSTWNFQNASWLAAAPSAARSWGSPPAAAAPHRDRRAGDREAGADVEALLGGRLPGEHLGAVVGAHLAAREGGAAAGEEVEGDVVGVGHTPILDSRESSCSRTRTSTGCRRRSGQRSATPPRTAGRATCSPRTGRYPAVGDRIVEDGGIAVVVRLAAAAEAAPQRVDGHRPKTAVPLLLKIAKSVFTICT